MYLPSTGDPPVPPRNSMNPDRRERVHFNKIQQRLRRETGRAIADFNMIEDGDRIMVCVSGGKDSFTLLDILLQLRRKAPVTFEIIAVNLDQKQPGFPEHVLPEYFRSIDVPYHIIEQDTYSIVQDVLPQGKTMCSLCSRLRRGVLYTFAKRHSMTKIALGHHRDDIVQTLFLNMFFGGRLKAMPPKLLSDDGAHIVIRPLAYCREEDIALYAAEREFPIIPCNLCGSQEHLQRRQLKSMLAEWNKVQPGRVDNIFRALQRVTPSHLADSELFDFVNLGRAGDTPARASAEDWFALGDQ